MTERKLASIKVITDLQPIPNADAIEVAEVDYGWKVVVKKGQVRLGQKVIYLEVDSWVPHDLAPFLSKGHEPREYNGIKGERLRTVKLRGQISQGLVLLIDETAWAMGQKDEYTALKLCEAQQGDDITELLFVQKYEPPIPAQLSGIVEGGFPTFIHKTDQERCQNLYREIFEKHLGETFEVTEKLEGSSMTVYLNDGKFGVCSRNWDLKEEQGNILWLVANELKLEDRLRSYGRNLGIQGELIGPGVQKNYYGLKNHQLRIFDVFDIGNGRKFRPYERLQILYELRIAEQITPIIHDSFMLADKFYTIDELLSFAEGRSKLADREREGLVFKSNDSEFHFKAVSNRFLIKQDKKDD